MQVKFPKTYTKIMYNKKDTILQFPPVKKMPNKYYIVICNAYTIPVLGFTYYYGFSKRQYKEVAKTATPLGNYQCPTTQQILSL
jgi:hypothetical protein